MSELEDRVTAELSAAGGPSATEIIRVVREQVAREIDDRAALMTTQKARWAAEHCARVARREA